MYMDMMMMAPEVSGADDDDANDVTVADLRCALIHTGQIEPSGAEQYKRCTEDLLYALFYHPQWLMAGSTPRLREYLEENYAPNIKENDRIQHIWEILEYSKNTRDPLPFQFFFLFMAANEESMARLVCEGCSNDYASPQAFLDKLREPTQNLFHTSFNQHNIVNIVKRYVNTAMLIYMLGEPSAHHVESNNSINGANKSWSKSVSTLAPTSSSIDVSWRRRNKNTAAAISSSYPAHRY